MKFLSISLLSLSLFIPQLVLAQAGGLVPCSGPDCTTDSVVALVANLISFLISMLGVIAVIVLVVVGFRMVVSRGNESEWTRAKEMFGNVVIGIILILAAWLIVDTIMRGLTGEGLNYWADLNR